MVKLNSSELYMSLGEIKGKLDSLITAFGDHAKEDAENFKEIKVKQEIIDKKLITFTVAVGFIVAGFPMIVNNWDKVKALLVG